MQQALGLPTGPATDHLYGNEQTISIANAAAFFARGMAKTNPRR